MTLSDTGITIMNRTKHNVDSRYLAILSHIQSLHPDEKEITLRFSDRTSMEVFKLAAMNALFAEKQQYCSDTQKLKSGHANDTQDGDNHRSLKGRLESVEDELYGHKPSRRAAILCRNPLFWCYLESTQGLIFDQIDSAKSKIYIRKTCLINHRRELDYDHGAQERYNKLIEDPYLAWLAQ